MAVIGARLADDILDWNWIHRRVEEIDFLDNRTFCRHVSIHLSLPKHGKTLAGTFVVPLTLMHKSAVSNLDFRDDQQGALSLLTTDERASFGFGVLRVAALNAAGEELLESRPEVDDDLRAIAAAGESDSAASFDSLLRRGENASGGTLWAALYHDPVFMAMARTFATQTAVLIELPDRQPRRVVTFSYNQRLTRQPVSRSVALGRALGWHPHRHLIPTPGLAHGGSYHLIIPAPPGIKATEHGFEMLVDDDDEPPVDGGRIMWREFDTLHLILKRARNGVSGVAEVAWRPRLTFPLEAWLTAVAILFTLVVLGANLGRLTAAPGNSPHPDTSQNAAALLLLIPALIAGYVAYERHPVERSLTLGILVALIGSGFCCFACAVDLSVGRSSGIYGVIWWASTVLAGAIAVVLTRTLIATMLEDLKFSEWRRQRPQRKYEGSSNF